MFPVDWNEVETFYFHAIRRVGWFSYDPKSIHSEGIKRWARYEEAGLSLKDEWREVPESRYSTGVTIISKKVDKEWKLIWAMHYGGVYSKEASSLLKSVLIHSYDTHAKRPFQGCRGPEEEWINDYYVYQNMLSMYLENSFKQFESHERIRYYQHGLKTSKDIGTGVNLGHHSIFGMALV